MQLYDLFIIGGGIHGTGIAVDASGRGLSVYLCEKNDLASGTSSASTKLIHGGLRYLEQMDFRLVHEALREREILIKKAPNLIKPLQFVLPQGEYSRSALLTRIGLLLYDHLAGKQWLPRSKKIKFSTEQYSDNPLKEKYRKGFTYWDAKTDDSRLVISNALAAKQLGAVIQTRTAFTKAKRNNNYWEIEVFDTNLSQSIFLQAKAIINAAGPWAGEIQKQIETAKHLPHLKLVKGSHIVVPRLYDGQQAFILPNPDKRIIFVIPYQSNFSLIGTTEVIFKDIPDAVHPSMEEIKYLCESVNHYFKANLTIDSVKWSFAGLRALCDQPNKLPRDISREYYFDVENINNLPVITLIGGKLTTYRALAETLVTKLEPYFPMMRKPWTNSGSLPGSDLKNQTVADFTKSLSKTYPFLPRELIIRYVQNYGSLSYKLLENVTTIADLGQHFGVGLYEREVNYLIQYEWAQTLEDILWRRTKLGLIMNAKEQDHLQQFLMEVRSGRECIS